MPTLIDIIIYSILLIAFLNGLRFSLVQNILKIIVITLSIFLAFYYAPQISNLIVEKFSLSQTNSYYIAIVIQLFIYNGILSRISNLLAYQLMRIPLTGGFILTLVGAVINTVKVFMILSIVFGLTNNTKVMNMIPKINQSVMKPLLIKSYESYGGKELVSKVSNSVQQGIEKK